MWCSRHLQDTAPTQDRSALDRAQGHKPHGTATLCKSPWGGSFGYFTYFGLLEQPPQLSLPACKCPQLHWKQLKSGSDSRSCE